MVPGARDPDDGRVSTQSGSCLICQSNAVPPVFANNIDVEVPLSTGRTPEGTVNRPGKPACADGEATPCPLVLADDSAIADSVNRVGPSTVWALRVAATPTARPPSAETTARVRLDWRVRFRDFLFVEASGASIGPPGHAPGGIVASSSSTAISTGFIPCSLAEARNCSAILSRSITTTCKPAGAGVSGTEAKLLRGSSRLVFTHSIASGWSAIRCAASRWTSGVKSPSHAKARS